MLKKFISITALLTMTGCGEGSASKEVEVPEVSGTNITSHITTTFIPPNDRLLMIIGQDSDTISEYISNMPEDNIEGVTLYSQLKSNNDNETLFGIVNKGFWNAGDVDFNKTLYESPKASLALGLAIDTCNQDNHPQNIADGRYDETLSTLVNYLKGLAPRKVFLRIGYEFDGPWNCYEPTSYKAAYRYIATALSDANANNVATVWQSAVWPDGYGNENYNTANPEHFDNWYPGDDVVDFVGISVFYRDLSLWNYQPPTTPDAGQQAAVTFARNHSKPVMISESAPQGYRIEKLTVSPIHENKPLPTTAEEIWQQWYVPYFDFIKANKDVIKVVAYINTHWDSQGMWQCQEGVAAGQDGCNQGNWGDTRVHINSYIKAKWLEQVNDESLWIQTSEY